MSACQATFPFSFLRAFGLPDWSAGGLLRYSAARSSVCRVVLQIPRARHARLVADILAKMSRGSSRGRMNKNASVEFQLNYASVL